MVKNLGSASILVDLTDNMISVYHGTDKTLLFKRKARQGTWENIWRTIKANK